MHRHLARAVLGDEFSRRIIRDIHRVRLGGAGHEDHRLGQRQLALGRAEALEGLDGVQGNLQRARVGQADVLGGHAHDAAAEVERIGAAIEHAREPVQCRVGGGAAHRLVQGRDLVVELLSALVEAPTAIREYLVQRGFDDLPTLAFRDVCRDFQQGQCTADIAIGGMRDLAKGDLINTDTTSAQAAFAIIQCML